AGGPAAVGGRGAQAPGAGGRRPADNGVENELRKIEACPARRARNPVILAVRGQERAFVGAENPSTPAIQVGQAAATQQNGIFRRDHSGALRAYPLRLFHTATSVWREGITPPALTWIARRLSSSTWLLVEPAASRTARPRPLGSGRLLCRALAGSASPSAAPPPAPPGP